MYYAIKDLLGQMVFATGVMVWALALAYAIVYLLLYKLVYLGFGSSLSMHRWFLRTGQMQADAYFFKSLFLGGFAMRGNKCMDYHMVFRNGAYWRSMWDHADSFQHRVERGDFAVVEEEEGIGEGVTA